MTVTSHLFEAYLKCPTKCFLRSRNETATGHPYADWFRTEQASFQSEGIKRLTQGTPQDECVASLLTTGNVESSKWRLAIHITARAQNLESTIHAVERVPSEGVGKPMQFIPIRFIFANRIGRDDRRLIAFDALVLSEMLRQEARLGKIIHGNDCATLEVKTGALASEVRKLTARIADLLSSNSPPDLVLNRHCAECEFQSQCRQKAIETDDLSLLSGITENGRKIHCSKGIFTVTQLSYTFRSRKTPKRAKNPAKPRYMALQALAIRENTVYIVINGLKGSQFQGKKRLPGVSPPPRGGSKNSIEQFLYIESRSFRFLVKVSHQTMTLSFLSRSDRDEPCLPSL